MRIWYQSAVEAGTAENYRAALNAHFERVGDETTQVDFSGVPVGTWRGYDAASGSGYPYLFSAQGCPAILQNAITAQREGYDAFIIGSFTEPAVREIRSVVDIPVISAFEANLLTACSLARTIGLVVPNEDVAYFAHLNVQEHKLSDRVAPIRILSPEYTDGRLNAAFDDPAELLEHFKATVREARRDYVDAIIPAEGIIAEIVAVNGLTQVDDVVVLDAIGIPILYAEHMVKLWRQTGLRVGRRWHYRNPSLPLSDL